MRWSNIVVEIVLTDWFPRTVYGMSHEHIDAVPAVLEQFVAFAHERRGIDATTTRQVQSSVVIWEDEFLEAMHDQPPPRARTALGDPASSDDEFLRAVLGDRLDPDYMDTVTDQLEARVIDLVGGRAAYDALDDQPLSDVEFDWSAVPADMVDLTRDTLGHLDRWSAEHFDAEVRSIARVTLGAVVATDRSVFKRSDRTDVLAAGILG